jgi:hypothetical protein
MTIFGLDRSRSLWHLILGPMIWAVHFCVIYAMTAIFCAKVGGDAAVLRMWIMLLTLAAAGLICVVGWRSWRQWDYPDDFDYEHDGNTIEDRREFLGHAGLLLCVVSLIGVIYVALPAAFIGNCT